MPTGTIMNYNVRTSCFHNLNSSGSLPPVGFVHEIQFVLEESIDLGNGASTNVVSAQFLPDPPFGPPPEGLFGTFNSSSRALRFPAALFHGIYHMLQVERKLRIEWSVNESGLVTDFQIIAEPAFEARMAESSPAVGSPIEQIPDPETAASIPTREP